MKKLALLSMLLGLGLFVAGCTDANKPPKSTPASPATPGGAGAPDGMNGMNTPADTGADPAAPDGDKVMPADDGTAPGDKPATDADADADKPADELGADKPADEDNQ